MSRKALDIVDLKKIYENGVIALDGVNLDIEEGDFFALLGVNGAGKTTTINVITDLVNKSSGTVKVFGNSIDDDFNLVKSLIGVVPQEFNFDIFSTCLDVVTTVAGYYGVNYYDGKKRATKVLNDLGLGSKLYTASRALSGGMKRRLMIARSLVHSPKLLLLDEPTVGVDIDLRHEMWNYLKQINENEKMTILLTTHYLEEVEQLCKNAAILKNGKVFMNDSVSNLLKKIDSEIYEVETEADLTKIENEIKAVFGENFVSIKNNAFEINITSTFTVADAINLSYKLNIKIVGFRPKGNRLEQLFLNATKK